MNPGLGFRRPHCTRGRYDIFFNHFDVMAQRLVARADEVIE
jgi:hypothetical protein